MRILMIRRHCSTVICSSSMQMLSADSAALMKCGSGGTISLLSFRNRMGCQAFKPALPFIKIEKGR